MPSALPSPDPSLVFGVLLWCLILVVARAAAADEREDPHPSATRGHETDQWF